MPRPPAPGGASTGQAPPILHEVARVFWVLGAWLGVPLLLAILVITLRDPQAMADTWASERAAWLGSGVLGGSDVTGVVPHAEGLRDAWQPAPAAVPPLRAAHGDLGRALTQAADRIGQGLWGQAWQVGRSYLPLLLVRLLVALVAVPAILAALAAAWWGTGVAANRLREAAGAFPQAGLNLFWWRAAAVCWCGIPYGLVAPVAYGTWWIAILGLLVGGTAVSLHFARAHWTTTGGM